MHVRARVGPSDNSEMSWATVTFPVIIYMLQKTHNPWRDIFDIVIRNIYLNCRAVKSLRCGALNVYQFLAMIV